MTSVGSRQRRTTHHIGARATAMLLGTALATTGALFGAVPAQAAPSAFTTSFESGETQPLANEPLTPSTTVTGSTLPIGSLLGHVTGVTADKENAPNEVAAALADGSASSKWLAFQNGGVITYTLDQAETLAKYSLTSANDAPGRDPSAWTVEGSNDAKTWTTVDARTAQSFTGRGTTNDYTAATPGSYTSYRLRITANTDGAALTQLADWSISDGSTTAPPPSPMVTQVGNGPVSGLNIRSTVGFSGTHALRYGGANTGAGEASATNVLYDDLSLDVTRNSELSYKIFPELGGDTSYPATYAAVDLQLSDGSLVSADPQVTDENGNRVSAKALGDGKVFFADQWNSVRIPLGDLAGKTVTKVLFTYDNDAAGAKAGTTFQGWVDDIRVDPSAERIDGASLTNYVDTRRGTNSSGSFSRGNNIPAAAVPNGFNFWTPMTNASSESWEYSWQSDNDDANLPRLQGLGISHEPSPWMGDRDQLAIMPSTDGTKPDATLANRGAAFDHADEIARPDLYSVKTQSGMVAEVAPADHGAVLRFAFPEDSGSVVFDNVSGDEKTTITVGDDGTVTGYTDGGSGLSVGASRMFFAGTFDHAPSSTGTAAGNRSSARYAAFSGLGADHVVELRLATSFISLDQARHNAALELTGKSFGQVQQSAAQQWNDRLGVVTVPASAASDGQLQSLYGSLYRMNLYPNSQFENTGSAAAPAYQHASPNITPKGDATATTTNAVVTSGKVYVNNGFWDTYRTVWPLYSMLYPKVSQQLVDGFVQQYRDGGWTPRWSSPGYADLMTGTSSDVAFANAYVNGSVDTKTALDAFDAGFKNATTVSDTSGTGRKAIDQSAFLGFVPDSLGESVSWGLEGTINDYGLAKMAEKLAVDPATPADRVAELQTDAAYLADRSKDYVNLFDKDAGFFQGRDADGTFQESAADFDPAEWGGAFTETDGWNFAFHAPFDVQGLAGLYGGDDALVQKLQQFYDTPETAENVGSYGGQIHEMLEARSVRIGQLGMSNQVSHHIPYIAAAAGDPSLTQSVVRETTRRLFTGNDIGQGYTGDEDNGEMSSWYVFSALGFYPLAQGDGEYTIGSPLFDQATLHLGGKDLTITAADNSTQNVYVQKASLNGKALDRATISQADVAKGGSLDFTMGAKPSTWGAGKTQGAAGHDAPAVAPKPLVDATTAGFGQTTSDDDTATGALTDDESMTATTFTSATPAITWKSAQGPVTVDQYTLTSAASGDAPTSWKLEGSSDGTTWVPLSTVSAGGFTNPLQTRPSTVEKPAALSWYRLTVTGTASGKAPSIGEFELLADSSATTGAFSLTATPDLTAEVGQPFSGNLAAITGAGTSASDYTVTVDWQDGEGPQTVTPTRSALGAWEVPGEHVFDTAGAHTVHVVATAGTDQASVDVPVTVSRTAPTLLGAFDNVCLGDPGQAANCDFEGRGFSRSSLADAGFVQGATNTVPGDAGLTFDLPAVTPGDPDNATGNGQVIPVPTGTDITQLSVIGTANEHQQDTTGTITYSDGTTADFPIGFGDWTASVAAPVLGDTLVATSDHRTVGVNGTDTAKPGIFSTPVFTVPDGKQAVSITLPVQTGSPTGTGRIHVFAIATDGTRVPVTALSATAGGTITGTAGTEVTGTLATATGGAITEGTTATVNWGDGSPLEDATVTVTDGTATVTGAHTYTDGGSYTAVVTVDDGTGSAAVSTPVEIAAAPVYDTALTTDAGSGVQPGGAVHVTGTGFAAGEAVTTALDGAASATTVTADDAGAIAFDVTAPTTTGTHAVSAVGAVSETTASATFQVLTPAGGGDPGNGGTPGDGNPGTGNPGTGNPGTGNPGTGNPGDGGTPGQGTWSPEFQLLASSGTQGTVVGYQGSGFAPGEHVALTLRSDPVDLGSATANGDGVIAGTFTVPSGATVGAHRVEALGDTSDTAVTAAFRVLARPAADAGRPPAAPGGWDGLAFTGSTVDPGVAAIVAGILVALGLAATGTVVVVRRRRRLG